MLQAASFYKDRWTRADAHMWLIEKGFAPIKAAHETQKMLHYRLIDPDKFTSFKSKPLSNGIILTIGLNNSGGKIGVSESNDGVRGDASPPLAVPVHDFKIDPEFEEASPLQVVFPLSKQGSILDKPVIGIYGRDRALDPNKVTIQDVPEKLVLEATQRDGFNVFQPGDMIYELMKTRQEGGIGFPFPSGSSTSNPSDWFRLWK